MKTTEKVSKKNSWLTLPNGLTLFRFFLIPFFLVELVQGNQLKAFIIFLLASLTDLLDGFIARTWNVRTSIGRILDPAADKLLLVSAFVVTTIPRFSHPFSIPVWLTTSVIARDTLIAFGALILFIWKGIKSFYPSLWGKICTFLQAITILFILMANAMAEQQFLKFNPLTWLFSPNIHSFFFILTLLATLISGIHYTAFSLKKVFFRPEENSSAHIGINKAPL